MLNNWRLGENLEIIYDTSVLQHELIPLIKNDYYEVSSGKLIEGLVHGSELPIILLVENRHIITSGIVSGISS